jgi:hypothetical protein
MSTAKVILFFIFLSVLTQLFSCNHQGKSNAKIDIEIRIREGLDPKELIYLNLEELKNYIRQKAQYHKDIDQMTISWPPNKHWRLVVMGIRVRSLILTLCYWCDINTAWRDL